MECGHDVMLDMPEELTRELLAARRRTLPHSAWSALASARAALPSWLAQNCSAQFTYAPAPSNGSGNGNGNGAEDADSDISTWSTILRLPHSAFTRKYRILLRENEWYVNSDEPRVTYAQFVELP